jgi:hypothetical protein
MHAFSTTEHDLERVALFMGHNLAIHKSHYRQPDNTFDSTVIASILLAMEENKLKKGVEVKQDFSQFLKEFVAQRHEDDSDDEEDVDDPENPGRINREIGKKICIHFKKFIEDEKKPRRNDVKEFLTILSNDYPEKAIPWSSIRDYVWNVVLCKRKKAQAEKKKAAEAPKAEKKEKQKQKKAQAAKAPKAEKKEKKKDKKDKPGKERKK